MSKKEIKTSIKLDAKQIRILNNIPKDITISKRVKTKVKVILLRNEGKSIKEIMAETHLCKRTIISYIIDFKNPDPRIGGYRFIHKNNYKQSSLNINDDNGDNLIIKEFKMSEPKSYKAFATRLKELYDISISESAIRRYLNKHLLYTSGSINPLTLDNEKTKEEHSS